MRLLLRPVPWHRDSNEVLPSGMGFAPLATPWAALDKDNPEQEISGLKPTSGNEQPVQT